MVLLTECIHRIPIPVVGASVKQLTVFEAMAVIAGSTEPIKRAVNMMEIINKTVSLMSVF